MIDGETYGPLLVAIGVLIIGIGAFFITITQSEVFFIVMMIGFGILFVGALLHMFCDIYSDYKDWKGRKAK